MDELSPKQQIDIISKHFDDAKDKTIKPTPKESVEYYSTPYKTNFNLAAKDSLAKNDSNLLSEYSLGNMLSNRLDTSFKLNADEFLEELANCIVTALKNEIVKNPDANLKGFRLQCEMIQKAIQLAGQELLEKNPKADTKSLVAILFGFMNGVSSLTLKKGDQNEKEN